MGAGASSSPESPNVSVSERRRGSLRAKITAIGMWAKLSNWREREQERANIRKQFDLLKKEKEEMYVEIEKDNSFGEDEVRFRRKSSQIPDFGRVIRNSDKPFWAAFESDTKCFLCKEPIQFEKGYPCRVCTRIFHEQCLNSSGDFRRIDKELCYRAKTNTGWSCNVCGNLGALLRDEEMDEMGMKFDTFDINQDAVISMDEYVRSRIKEHEDREGRQPDDFDIQRYKLDFRLADIDGNGSLDWWEFINHEAQKLLMNRPKDQLVEMLTEKEILKAKSLFRTMDKDNKGFITEIGAKNAYRNWYQQVDAANTGRHESRYEAVEFHVNLCTKMFMNMDNTEHECIFWPQFLDEQALYILTARPNQADMFKKQQLKRK